MSRLGLNQQGQITPIDPNNPDKTIQPIIDPKAVQLFQTNNHDQQVKNTGAMEALSRIGMHVISQTAGPAAQARLKEAQLATQRIPTQIGDTTLDLTPGQSANVLMAKAKSDQQAQEKLPEVQFQKKYQLMPKDILSQPMGYEQGKDARS